MLSSFVLRLAAEALAARRIAGRVEVVETGEATSLRSADELIAFLYEQGGPRGRSAGARSTTEGESDG